jgi:hypothetical protein
MAFSIGCDFSSLYQGSYSKFESISIPHSLSLRFIVLTF